MSPNNRAVFDTHALVWYLENNPQLSVDARGVFEAVDRGDIIGFVPTIVLAEMLYMSERRRTPLSFAEVVNQLQRGDNFEIVSLYVGIVTRMSDLTTMELHDRIIVATAISVGARLVTRDRAVRSSGLVECVW